MMETLEQKRLVYRYEYWVKQFNGIDCAESVISFLAWNGLLNDNATVDSGEFREWLMHHNRRFCAESVIAFLQVNNQLDEDAVHDFCSNIYAI